MFEALPWYWSVFFLLVFLITSTILLFHWIRKITSQTKLKEDQEIISYGLNTISLFYCVLVGLVVIDVQTQHNSAQDVIVQEAAILMDMYKTINTFEVHGKKDIGAAIREYAENVIKNELPLMQQGIDYVLVHHVPSDKLWKAVAEIQPKDMRELAMYQSMLHRMNQLTDTRFQRFTSVDGRAGPFLWVVLIYGGLIVVGCSMMFSSKSKLAHTIHLSFNVSLITLILLLIYALDSPFNGPTAVPLTAFEEVIQHIDADQHKQQSLDS